MNWRLWWTRWGIVFLLATTPKPLLFQPAPPALVCDYVGTTNILKCKWSSFLNIPTGLLWVETSHLLGPTGNSAKQLVSSLGAYVLLGNQLPSFLLRLITISACHSDQTRYEQPRLQCSTIIIIIYSCTPVYVDIMRHGTWIIKTTLYFYGN